MPYTIYLPEKNPNSSGICVTYTKSRRVLPFGGWYDGMVGIEGGEMTLAEFFRSLKTPRKDCERAFDQIDAQARDLLQPK
jgi:hypothetical protein